MPLNYVAGSKLPTAADINTLLALSVSALVPNDLEILLDALNRKQSRQRTDPQNQPTLGALLP
jgi:hypothetical protein